MFIEILVGRNWSTYLHTAFALQKKKRCFLFLCFIGVFFTLLSVPHCHDIKDNVNKEVFTLLSVPHCHDIKDRVNKKDKAGQNCHRAHCSSLCHSLKYENNRKPGFPRKTENKSTHFLRLIKWLFQLTYGACL